MLFPLMFIIFICTKQCTGTIYERGTSYDILSSAHAEILEDFRDLIVPPGFGSASHVLIIGYDGLGAEYLQNATDIPTIQSLIREGSFSFQARIVFPLLSAPNWGTILTGAGPEETGIGPDNEWVPPHIDSLLHIEREKKFLEKVKECGITRKELAAQGCPTSPSSYKDLPPITGAGSLFPTVFRHFKNMQPMGRTAASFHWEWFWNLLEMNERSPVDLVHQEYSDRGVANKMAEFIKASKPNLMFVQFDEIDATGHRYNFGSPEYYVAVQERDKDTEILVNALKESGIYNDTLIILCSDHGATLGGNWHSDADLITIQVPIVLHGPGIRVGKDLSRKYVRNMDIAPTAMHALGIHPNSYWVGRPLVEAFHC